VCGEQVRGRGAAVCDRVEGCVVCAVLLQLAALELGNLHCTLTLQQLQVEQPSVCVAESDVGLAQCSSSFRL
jgi:hypothetical protein